MNKDPNLKKENHPVEAKSNNNLLIVLGVLVAIIIGLFIHAMSGNTAPSSLVDENSVNVETEPADTVEARQVPNQEKVVPVTQIKTAKEEPDSKKVQPVSATSSAGIYTHTVKPGETLFSIAQRYNYPQQEVKNLNKLNETSLKAEQQIKIRITALHKVGTGEGINAIARKYSVDKALILKANNLSSESLQLDQRLIIPLP